MADLIPDIDLETSSNQKKLNDIWWGVRSVTGAGRGVLRQTVALFDKNWQVSKQTTTLETEVGALPQNFAIVRQQIAELTELVRQLSVAQGVTIDYAAIAKAVVDEEARRLQGKEGA